MIEHRLNLVSVIVPIYNSELFLERCIRSIVRQTYSNLEIILVNDGSTDSSLKICKKYSEQDERIKVIHQENHGVATARNVGMQNSTGDFLMFVDSDDELCLNAVEVLLIDIVSFNADVVSALKCRVDERGLIHKEYEDHEKIKYVGSESIEAILFGDRQANSVCAKLFRKKFIGDLRFADKKNINEDGFFNFQCYSKKPILIQHNICVYMYYSRMGSASRQVFSEKYLDMLYFLDRKKEIIENEYPELLDKFSLVEVKTHLSFLGVLCRTIDQQWNAYAKNSIKIVRELYSTISVHVLTKQERKMVAFIMLGLYPLIRKYIYLKKYREKKLLKGKIA